MTAIIRLLGHLIPINMVMVEKLLCKMMEIWLFIIMMANQLGAQELMVERNKKMVMVKSSIFEID